MSAVSGTCLRVKDILNSCDFIRTRELQRFCLKEGFLQVKFGVGVHIALRGKEGTFRSEFELLSHGGFYDLGVR